MDERVEERRELAELEKNDRDDEQAQRAAWFHWTDADGLSWFESQTIENERAKGWQ
jgi:hypothetical protein